MNIRHAFLYRSKTNSTIILELPSEFDNKETLKAWLEWHMPDWSLLDCYEICPIGPYVG